ncbi:MAG: hypothetical protein ACTSRS_09300 [Candidatus Helarchaeota archaeon]
MREKNYTDSDDSERRGRFLYLMKLEIIIFITGLISFTIGLLLELLYWTIWKNKYWILLVYPPPSPQQIIAVVPCLGTILILIGAVLLITSLWLYLRADVERIKKENICSVRNRQRSTL